MTSRLFFKIPLTIAASEIVNHESQYLHHLNQYDFKYIKLPKEKFSKNYLQQSDLSIECNQRSSEWTNVHQQAIAELFSFTKKKTEISATEFWKKIEFNLLELKKLPAHRAIPDWNLIIDNLILFFHHLNLHDLKSL